MGAFSEIPIMAADDLALAAQIITGLPDDARGALGEYFEGPVDDACGADDTYDLRTLLGFLSLVCDLTGDDRADWARILLDRVAGLADVCDGRTPCCAYFDEVAAGRAR